ncbi:MAG: hypothetical protein WBI40_05965 [Methylococcaceae bacterium]
MLSSTFQLPSVEELLISGGDERLALNSFGFNKYGCSPLPIDDILSFSSSTASSLSSDDFAVAEKYRHELEKQLSENSPETIYQNEAEKLCLAWQKACNFSEKSRVLLFPSGTDLHHVVAKQFENTTILMVETNETGSGVAQALQFENHVVSVPLRLKNGELRPTCEVNNDFENLATQAIQKKQRFLIVMVDQSKTGLIAPSVECVLKLKNQFSTLNVLVDACQFRLSVQTLNAYLQHDFMIALTGSKFLAAPSFSGMLVLPEKWADSFKNSNMPNFGLLIRNQIALVNYQKFRTLPNEKICDFIEKFAEKIKTFLVKNSNFELLEIAKLKRDSLSDSNLWDTLPTIFPFVLYRNNQPLSRLETAEIYKSFTKNSVRFEIGQPVLCGSRNGIEVSALRLCLSSRLIVQAILSEKKSAEIIENALFVLNEISRCVTKTRL